MSILKSLRVIFFIAMTSVVVLLFLYQFTHAEELSLSTPIIIGNVGEIKWDSNKESDLKQYIVHVYTDSFHLTSVTVDTSFVINFTEFSIVKPTRIYYYVEAEDIAGNISIPSDTVNSIYMNNRALFGDWDKSGKVDGIDMVMFWNSFWCRKGINQNYNEVFDANLDGFIDGLDHLYITTNFWEELN